MSFSHLPTIWRTPRRCREGGDGSSQRKEKVGAGPSWAEAGDPRFQQKLRDGPGYLMGQSWVLMDTGLSHTCVTMTSSLAPDAPTPSPLGSHMCPWGHTIDSRGRIYGKDSDRGVPWSLQLPPYLGTLTMVHSHLLGDGLPQTSPTPDTLCLTSMELPATLTTSQ